MFQEGLLASKECILRVSSFPKDTCSSVKGCWYIRGFLCFFQSKMTKLTDKWPALLEDSTLLNAPNLSGGDWNLLLSELLGNYLTQSYHHALTEDEAVGTENMEESCSLSWSQGPCTWQHRPGLFVSLIHVVIPRPVFGTWMSPDLCLASLASGWLGITY